MRSWLPGSRSCWRWCGAGCADRVAAGGGGVAAPTGGSRLLEFLPAPAGTVPRLRRGRRLAVGGRGRAGAGRRTIRAWPADGGRAGRYQGHGAGYLRRVRRGPGRRAGPGRLQRAGLRYPVGRADAVPDEGGTGEGWVRSWVLLGGSSGIGVCGWRGRPALPRSARQLRSRRHDDRWGGPAWGCGRASLSRPSIPVAPGWRQDSSGAPASGGGHGASVVV